MYTMLFLMAVGFASAAISFTITFTGIFKPVREAIGGLHPKLDELMHCPWCFNHYVVLFILLIAEVPTLYVINSRFFNFIITWFCIVGIGGVIHYVLLRAYEPVSKSLLQRKIEKAKGR